MYSVQDRLEGLLLVPLPRAPDLDPAGVHRLLREPLVLILAGSRVVVEQSRAEKDGQKHDQRERRQEQQERASSHGDPRRP